MTKKQLEAKLKACESALAQYTSDPPNVVFESLLAKNLHQYLLTHEIADMYFRGEWPRDDYEELFRGVKLRIGLRQQGHIPTIERMLAEGATWDEIGKAIGWHGPTVERWYKMDQSNRDSSL